MDVSKFTYQERLATFSGYWDDCRTTARQLAAIGHVAERPPLEVLEYGSRCTSCSNFVRKDLSARAFGDIQGSSRSYQDDFRGFAFHFPECKRLQVRIPLEPQAMFAGLHGRGGIAQMRSRFEPRPFSYHDSNLASSPIPQRQSCSLFSLPAEIRVEIYAAILGTQTSTAEIVPLNRDSARTITRHGYDKIGPRDTSKPNFLRTCRVVHNEALPFLYSTTTFTFALAKTMYLFLRNIGASGRALLTSVDVHCGSREDAVAFALLASCEKLRTITIRLPRPRILFPGSPLWCVDGMAALLALSGLKGVRFGDCDSTFGCLKDGMKDAEIIRRELTRGKGEDGGLTWVDGQIVI